MTVTEAPSILTEPLDDIVPRGSCMRLAGKPGGSEPTMVIRREAISDVVACVDAIIAIVDHHRISPPPRVPTNWRHSPERVLVPKRRSRTVRFLLLVVAIVTGLVAVALGLGFLL